MKVFFRVDASAEIGLGHLVRCLALADAIATQGGEAVFVLAQRTAQAQGLLDMRKHTCIFLGEERPSSQEEDARACLPIFERESCVVVDKYDLDSQWESKIRNCVRRLLVIDDLADRQHDCDLLVDSGYGRAQQDYAALVPPSAGLCLGTDFALLRPEFAQLHDSAAPWPQVCKAHVFMGGGAASHWLPLCVEALLQAHPVLKVCAIGTADDRRMAPLLQSHASRLQWQQRVENMANTYAQCDVAIGSPGISTWERACIGLPSAVFATAENQIPILRMLDERGFCRYLGAVWETSKSAMVRLVGDFLADTPALQRLRDNGVRAVDGQGVGRVVTAFLYEGT